MAAPTAPHTLVEVPQRSLIATMAMRYGLEASKFLATIQKTIFPQNAAVSIEQTAAFLAVANQYELNPFTKEIYAFPSRGGIVPIVSVDGWASLINRQKELDGIQFTDHFDEHKKLTAITCKMFRKDRQYATEVTEYMTECFRDTEPWKKWPARMLRHKALIQCARYAFALTGIYDPDEAERIAESVPRNTFESNSEAMRVATDSRSAQLDAKYNHSEGPSVAASTPDPQPASEEPGLEPPTPELPLSPAEQQKVNRRREDLRNQLDHRRQNRNGSPVSAKPSEPLDTLHGEPGIFDESEEL